MTQLNAKKSATRLARALERNHFFVADIGYTVCGIRKGDMLVYNRSAKPAIGLVVILSTDGKLRAANFLEYQIAPLDPERAGRVKAGRRCVLEWDGKDERYIEGVAYPVSHVIVPGCGIVALDLGLESPDDTTVCEVLLDAVRTFGPMLGRLRSKFEL